MFNITIKKFSSSLKRTQRPVLDKVMATHEWPAPYYKRMFKANPIRKKDQYSLYYGGHQITEQDSLKVRNILAESPKGQEILSYVENNVPMDNYVLKQNDVGRMASGYALDLVNYIDVANKENVRILKGKSLL